MLAISSSTAWAQRSPGDSGDIVETIGPGPSTPSAPAPPPRPPAAPSPHSFNLRGWARASAIVGLDRTGPTTPPELRYVPHDRLVVAQQMFLRLRYA
ncbi:MAG: hypothetical protein ACXVAN_15020, partial [Polyangia bacterium]